MSVHMGSPGGGRRTIIKNFIFLLLLLLFFVCSSFSCTNGHQEGTKLIIIPQFKVARKLAYLDVVLDYQGPVHNPSHDPGRGGLPVAKTALNP